ncbi:ABD1 [Symbiodinium sp. KB8]|nr:ABD1 [Symbiodinium sp. KB8]
MQTKRQRCLSTTAPQASQVLAVLYNGLNPFSNGRPPATHLSRLSFNQSKSVPGILSGLPSGAAESQSRQAAKVESLAELQQAPPVQRIHHRLQATITTALLAKVQQPPLHAADATGAADAADAARAGTEPGGLPVASAVPEVEVKAETTAALATSCAAALAPEGKGGSVTDRCSNSPARGFEFQAAAARPRRIGNFDEMSTPASPAFRAMAPGGKESQSMPPPSQKRRLEPQDDLPHPRRQCLNRKFESDLESRFRNFLRDAPLQANEAKPFPGSSFNAASPGVALVIGRVVGGKGKPHDIVLPVASEVLMEDGPGHSFVPDLSETQVSKLRAFLDSRVVAHKGKPPNERRWASVSLEQRNAVLCKWRSAATFYCPGSKWHYQLRLREPQSTEGAGKDRKEFNLVFQKVPGGQDPTWTVSIVQEAEKIWTEVRMNEVFLFSHRDRMLASQQHCFSRLCRDFRRNAQALQKVLEGIDPHSSGNGGRRLFYPGIFDMASQVQEFYDRRTRGQVDAKGVDATARLRSFNNCIKTLLLESFVDDMAGSLRILDLCCGRGQDLKKYSRAHRSCNVESLVCVDFVAEAVAEARRRYSEMAARGHEAGRPDFAASFYTGDCSSAEVFNELAQDGFSEFDVIVCQFGLHYLLGAEEDATRFLQRIFALLRPGGRFIATVPSCEVLADLYEQATPFTDSGRSRERELQQSLFQVRFEGEAWRHLDTEGGRLSLDEVFQSRWGLPYLFWLKGAVCAEEYLLPWEAFEKLAESTGFSVMADASFPDLLSLLKDKSKFFNDFFSKDRRNENMSCDEEQVFKLYSGFVLERPETETEKNGCSQWQTPSGTSQAMVASKKVEDRYIDVNLSVSSKANEVRPMSEDASLLSGLEDKSWEPESQSCKWTPLPVQPLEDAGIGSSIQTMPPAAEAHGATSTIAASRPPVPKPPCARGEIGETQRQAGICSLGVQLGILRLAETAKSYTRTFVRLFEEERKAPSEMATQEFFELTKASPKNKSGNGQRAASVAAFRKFYDSIQGDVSKLERPDETLKFCQVSLPGMVKARAPKRKEPESEAAQAKESNGPVAEAENGRTVKKRKREPRHEDVEGTAENGRPQKHPHEQPQDASNDTPQEASAPVVERKVVKLDQVFALLGSVDAAQRSSDPERSGSRPRVLFVHGRDPAKMMTSRVHGVYTELEETKDGRPAFEKVDHEKKTYISYVGDKKTWRMSVSLTSQGDFAKVKEPADLPWQVSRPWKVFNGDGSYDEDAALRCDFLDPEKPAPDLEVEVCLPMWPPAGQMGTSSSSKRPRPPPAESQPTSNAGDTKLNPRVLKILGLDNSIKNASRVMGVYAEQAMQHSEQPVFKKTDEAKPSFLYFDAQKERWRIAKSLEDKGDFAHVKDKGQLPWLLKKPWKVYDGDKYAEVPGLRVEEADPSILEAAEANVQKRSTKAAENRSKVERKASTKIRDRKWLGQQMSADELPLQALRELPQDAPSGHDAWRYVKWEPSHNRALFQFRGIRFQTTQFGCGSRHAAEVVARACYVMLADGKGKEEVMTFRDDWYRRMRSFNSGQATSNGHAESGSETSPNKQKKVTPATETAEADGAQPEGPAQASSPPPASSASGSSSSSESDSESVGKASGSESQEEAADAGQRGVGFLDPDKAPGAMGRVCAKMAVRTGLRCFRCYFERHKCRCKRG